MPEQKVKKNREEVLNDIKLAHQNRHSLAEELFSNINSRKAEIERKLEHFRSEEPDLIYRFYHQSYKVFILNNLTEHAVEFFRSLAPGSCALNQWFLEITHKALSKKFDSEETNSAWLAETLPILQGYWHSKYFLEQMLAAVNDLDAAPDPLLPSGWAAVLYLYDLR